MAWPGPSLRLETVTARPGSAIRMLGDDGDLEFRQDEAGLTIQLPERLQQPESRPCKQAFVFKIELTP